ncbi:MAG: methyltransferase [Planctomycetes bacterium]|nr:methyltransferase [Planctomycetota bacterium]
MIKTIKIHLNRELGIILFSIILLGCYATVAQALVIREFLVVSFGNELCLGIVLGTWLMGVALGAASGAKVAARLKHSFSIYIVLLFIMCVTLPLEIVLIRSLRHMLHIPAGQYMPILLLLISAIFTISTFSFFIGLIFPFTCKVIHGLTQDPAADIGIVFFLESIGSLFGGVLLTYILITRFTPTTIIMAFDAVLLITIILLLLFARKDVIKSPNPKHIHPLSNPTWIHHSIQKKLCGRSVIKADKLECEQSTPWWCGVLACTLLLIAIVTLMVTVGANTIDNYFIKARWHSLNPGIELLESTDSRHENIAIGVRDGQYSVFGNGRYNFAFPDDYASSQTAHLVMTQHTNPEKVLLIGGGMGGLIREMLKHPIAELHYIEMDPALIEITQKYLPQHEMEALSDKRVSVFHTDGRRFIKQSADKKKYDLIFVNIPDPSTSFINRFYTLQFFHEAKRILHRSGIFVLGITSAVNYIGEEVGNYAGSVYKTLHNIFPYILVSPGHEIFFFAGNTPGSATFDIPTLIERYSKRGISSEFFSEHLFHSMLPPGRVAFLEKELTDNGDFKINSDTKPVAYFYNLMLWDKFTGARLGRTLEWLEKGDVKVFLIPISLFLLFRWLYVISLKRDVGVQQRFNCITAITTSGFAGIALEIVLIFSFQNIYGYVYEKIGLIIALFMFGLAMGSYISNRMILQEKSLNLLGPGTLFIYFQKFFSTPRIKRGETSTTNLVNKKSSKDVYWIKTLIFIEAILVFYTAILPPILHRLTFQFFGAEYLFMLFVIIAGILPGIEFPISNKLHFLHKNKIETTAGVIDSADHVGGFVGALLVGVLFVPLFGIPGSCLIIMTLKLVSMLLLLHLYFQKRKAL